MRRLAECWHSSSIPHRYFQKWRHSRTKVPAICGTPEAIFLPEIYFFLRCFCSACLLFSILPELGFPVNLLWLLFQPWFLCRVSRRSFKLYLQVWYRTARGRKYPTVFDNNLDGFRFPAVFHQQRNRQKSWTLKWTLNTFVAKRIANNIVCFSIKVLHWNYPCKYLLESWLKMVSSNNSDASNSFCKVVNQIKGFGLSMSFFPTLILN